MFHLSLQIDIIKHGLVLELIESQPQTKTLNLLDRLFSYCG